MQVLISGGFSPAYQAVLPALERAAGMPITTLSGASQGKGPQVISEQLARGVAADVVILSREGLSELIAESRIVPGTDVDLATTPIGVAVRAGAPKPDVATVDTFKAVLLNARTVAVPASTSGIFLVNDVFPRLGVTGRIDVRITPRGTGSTAMVAAGEASVAVQPVSEILAAPGVELAGIIAAEIQLIQTFSAAVVVGSTRLDAAKRLIAVLRSEQARSAIRNSGMDPL